jgi:hypothetical protein
VAAWFTTAAAGRLLEPIGSIPPAEAEDQYYAAADNIDGGVTHNPRPPADPGSSDRWYAATRSASVSSLNERLVGERLDHAGKVRLTVLIRNRAHLAQRINTEQEAASLSTSGSLLLC